jgi:hypothetical protein
LFCAGALLGALLPGHALPHAADARDHAASSPAYAHPEAAGARVMGAAAAVGAFEIPALAAPSRCPGGSGKLCCCSSASAPAPAVHAPAHDSSFDTADFRALLCTPFTGLHRAQSVLRLSAAPRAPPASSPQS